MLTNDLVPCFVQTFKTDSKTGYEKALLVGVFDKTTTDLDCCISSSSRDTGKTRQPVAVVMCKDGRLRPEVRGAGHIQGGLMDEIKLKPCPFCGSKRVLSNLYSWEANADNYAHFVYCQKC